MEEGKGLRGGKKPFPQDLEEAFLGELHRPPLEEGEEGEPRPLPSTAPTSTPSRSLRPSMRLSLACSSGEMASSFGASPRSQRGRGGAVRLRA